MHPGLQYHINHIAQICHEMGITQAVISPGSRNAPLILAFARHPGLQCLSIIDERAAAYIAMGMAQYTRKPVALICTSGTAVLNFYPAIAEAYYQQVPLLVITADRPPELIDQWDGQTIRQQHIFQAHSRGNYTIPDNLTHPEALSALIQTCTLAATATMQPIPGPVHLNVPLREPLYPGTDDIHQYATADIQLPGKISLPAWDRERFTQVVTQSPKILVLCGMQAPDQQLQESWKTLQQQQKVVMLGDIASSLQPYSTCQYWDLTLGSASTATVENLQPDLLVTIGTSTVSKNLKQFLRKYKPAQHWHFSEHGVFGNPFESLTERITADPDEVLQLLRSANGDTAYVKHWESAGEITAAKMAAWAQKQQLFNETIAAHTILQYIPADSVFHVANSMPVRYASMLGIPQPGIHIYSNRGTSGIDGCNATTVGSALASGKMTTLLTGDVAFFYDANGLWHHHIPSHLRIVILNNQGGGIFRLLPGPASQPELETFFETRHQRTAAALAKDLGFGYTEARDMQSLKTALHTFWQPGTEPRILEVFTDPLTNQQAYSQWKAFLAEPGN